MKRILMTTAAAVALTGAAQAGGIDRSGQGLGALFETGRYLELSFGSVMPKVDGRDLAAPWGGQPTGEVALDYTQWALSYKYDINDTLSFALVLDQPFGADILYPTTSVALGGTNTVADATALTGILRYKTANGFSVHGGVRAQKADAFVRLQGGAYGPLNGYNVTLASDVAPGYLIGVAYEKPEIALRVSLTYNSAITHKFDTVEQGLPGALAALNGVTTVTEVTLPQSVNLDFQSGVAKDTLVFGQIRWADWSSFKLRPRGFTSIPAPGQADGLISLEDTITYTLGVGRRFNENWAGSISLTYEGKGSDQLVSPLAPTDGKRGITVGAVYTRDNLKLTMGINYTEVGDAFAETGTPDAARASMTENHALGVGVKVGWSF